MKGCEHSQVFKKNQTNFNQFWLTLIYTIASVVITACGSSGIGNDNSPSLQKTSNSKGSLVLQDTITQFGKVEIYRVSAKSYATTSISGEAVFYEYNNPMTQEEIDFQTGLGTVDTCIVKVDNYEGDSFDFRISEGDTYFKHPLWNKKHISAGEVLTISTPTGNWPELASVNRTGFGTVYRLDASGASLVLPKNSSVNTPGNEFPAFDAITIPVVADFTNVSFSNANEAPNSMDISLSSETSVTWTVPDNTDEQGLIIFALEKTIDAIDVDDTPEADIYYPTAAYIRCFTQDDGEFSFPENVNTVLSQFNFDSKDLIMTRTRFNAEVRDDTAMIVIGGARYYEPLVY